MNMLLELDEIPWWHDILASLCTWLLLAGYVVLPGAFTSIRNSRVLSDEAGAAGKAIVKAAQTWPVLLVASICCAIGVSGMAWLWYSWRRNYVWLLNKIIV
jgi:predicted histidine transporter YuiF (NhaC family)